MAEFEIEKEALNAELTDYKAKLLKLEEKERQWETYIQLLKKSDAELKAKLAIKEKELQGRSAKRCGWRDRYRFSLESNVPYRPQRYRSY